MIKKLIGKTIINAEIMGKKGCDDMGWLLLTFSDGTEATVVSSYGGYTGRSEDEYPTCIIVTDEKLDLIKLK